MSSLLVNFFGAFQSVAYLAGDSGFDLGDAEVLLEDMVTKEAQANRDQELGQEDEKSMEILASTAPRAMHNEFPLVSGIDDAIPESSDLVMKTFDCADAGGATSPSSLSSPGLDGIFETPAHSGDEEHDIETDLTSLGGSVATQPLIQPGAVDMACTTPRLQLQDGGVLSACSTIGVNGGLAEKDKETDSPRSRTAVESGGESMQSAEADEIAKLWELITSPGNITSSHFRGPSSVCSGDTVFEDTLSHFDDETCNPPNLTVDGTDRAEAGKGEPRQDDQSMQGSSAETARTGRAKSDAPVETVQIIADRDPSTEAHGPTNDMASPRPYDNTSQQQENAARFRQGKDKLITGRRNSREEDTDGTPGRDEKTQLYAKKEAATKINPITNEFRLKFFGTTDLETQTLVTLDFDDLPVDVETVRGKGEEMQRSTEQPEHTVEGGENISEVVSIDHLIHPETPRQGLQEKLQGYRVKDTASEESPPSPTSLSVADKDADPKEDSEDSGEITPSFISLLVGAFVPKWWKPREPLLQDARKPETHTQVVQQVGETNEEPRKWLELQPAEESKEEPEEPKKSAKQQAETQSKGQSKGQFKQRLQLQAKGQGKGQLNGQSEEQSKGQTEQQAKTQPKKQKQQPKQQLAPSPKRQLQQINQQDINKGATQNHTRPTRDATHSPRNTAANDRFPGTVVIQPRSMAYLYARMADNPPQVHEQKFASHHLVLWADGSWTHAQTGIAVVFRSDPRKRGADDWDDNAYVLPGTRQFARRLYFKPELVAVEAALTIAVDRVKNSRRRDAVAAESVITRVTVFTDSLEVLEHYSLTGKQNHKYFVRGMRSASALCGLGVNLELRWSPGHCGLAGNERADAVAKLALRRGPCPDGPVFINDNVLECPILRVPVPLLRASEMVYDTLGGMYKEDRTARDMLGDVRNVLQHEFKAILKEVAVTEGWAGDYGVRYPFVEARRPCV